MGEVTKAEADRDGANERANIGDESEEFDENDAERILKEDMHLWLLEELFGEEVAKYAAGDRISKVGEEDVDGETDKTEREADDGNHDEDADERNHDEENKAKSEVFPRVFEVELGEEALGEFGAECNGDDGDK